MFVLWCMFLEGMFVHVYVTMCQKCACFVRKKQTLTDYRAAVKQWIHHWGQHRWLLATHPYLCHSACRLQLHEVLCLVLGHERIQIENAAHT